MPAYDIRWVCQGMWLSGRALASHVRGPGFDPRHLHIFFIHQALDYDKELIYIDI